MSTETSTPNATNLQPRFGQGHSMRLAGLTGHYADQEIDRIPEQWQRLVARGEVAGRIGRIEYAYVGMTPTGADYLSGYEVEAGASLPDGFVDVRVPAYRYAVFAHEGHVSQMRHTFAAIFSQWLPTAGITLAHGVDGYPFCLEVYTEAFNPRTGTGGIEIWLPVEHAA
jgi:AraC family transcriptional regulator